MLGLGVFKGAPSRKITLNHRTLELTSAEYESLVEFVQRERWKRLTPMVQSAKFKALRRSNPMRAAAELDKRYDNIGRDAREEWLRRHRDVLDKLRAAPYNRRPPSRYIEAEP